MRRATYALVGAALVAGLAGCTSGSSGSDSGGRGGAATPDVPEGTVLTTADSDLGQIVVDAQGMTVYYYTPDVPGSGASACTDDCLAAWPPVHATDDPPVVDGVTGDVGTILGNDGERQVTLDGRPLYLYAGDGEPGDVLGQGIDDIWWVVAPDGTEIRQMPASPDMPGY
jgi:predicted lipoprotein with Yx(FWY)xxD motif